MALALSPPLRQGHRGRCLALGCSRGDRGVPSVPGACCPPAACCPMRTRGTSSSWHCPSCRGDLPSRGHHRQHLLVQGTSPVLPPHHGAAGAHPTQFPAPRAKRKLVSHSTWGGQGAVAHPALQTQAGTRFSALLLALNEGSPRSLGSSAPCTFLPPSRRSQPAPLGVRSPGLGWFGSGASLPTESRAWAGPRATFCGAPQALQELQLLKPRAEPAPSGLGLSRGRQGRCQT